ncbi:hypothetical protein BDA99DRAFT_519445 [Phascolomyces articulosus]|uniref:Calponin-homology (CH) domain-containing protein n=1 Tax=Phascolomyces articulosus TaxID=60185 RepID=A0AAD5K7A7_9FUNG|nr:hypothetical protein BDA99DRAFT_519445 [Phascolomyces articulosus]
MARMLQQSTLSVSDNQQTQSILTSTTTSTTNSIIRNNEEDLLQQRANNMNMTTTTTHDHTFSQQQQQQQQRKRTDNVVRAMSPEGRRYLKPVNGIQTKGFARSAQRRSSVLTLGSIERLQHFYAKRDLKVNKGGILGFKKNDSNSITARVLKEQQQDEEEDDDEEMFLPEDRQQPPPSWMQLDVETDLDVLLSQCFRDVQVMLHNWSMISECSDSDTCSDNEGAGFHIASLLQSVTRTLDSVRTYTFHRNDLTEHTMKKLRHAGIQLLGTVKELELRHQSGELGDDEGFIPYIKLQPERTAIIDYLIIVEDYAFNPSHHHILMDEPVLFGPDISTLLSSRREQQEQEQNNSDSNNKRRASTDITSWLDPTCFVNDDMGRFHALLCDNILGEEVIPDPHSDEDEFLTQLADGRILCNVYNNIVNRSCRPFGLITKIHQDTKRTFRATENLRFFAAACKFRFDLNFYPFDPAEVARKTERGLFMLKLAIDAFCNCAINELRESVDHASKKRASTFPTSPSIMEHVENTLFSDNNNNEYHFP